MTALIRDTPRWQAIGLARHWADLPARYKLGAGGRNPHTPTPFTQKDGVEGADCIGFVLWCLGLNRYQPQVEDGTIGDYGGWINTDSAMGDANSAQVFFEFTDKPAPGDLVVFPSIPDGRGGRKRIGHVGLITATGDTSGWTSNLWKRPASERKRFLRQLEVVDCAAALTRRLLGRAIRRTTAAASWNKPDAVFLRYTDFVYRLASAA